LPVPYLDLPTIVDLEYGGQASPQKIAVYKIVIGLYGIEVIPDNLLIDGSVVIVPGCIATYHAMRNRFWLIEPTRIVKTTIGAPI